MPLEIVDIFDPFTVEALNTPTKLFSGRQSMYAYSCYVQVRSMGDATYVGVGTQASQSDRLLGVGDFRGWEIPGMVVDVGKLFVISDFTLTEPVLEVSGLFESSMR
jgi:hypothetical protein